MKSDEFKKKQEEAYKANFHTPPEEGENFSLFGERQQCIKPTLLNRMRENLGYPRKSIFSECKRKEY